MKAEHTIQSGLEALVAQSNFHHREAQRFEQAVKSFLDAEKLLADSEKSKVGRPMDRVHRTKLNDALSRMPETFSLPEIKKAAGLDRYGASAREVSKVPFPASRTPTS